MIAFLATNYRDAKTIIMSEFGDCGWRVMDNRRVVKAADTSCTIGLICTKADHLRGLELSGLLVLDERPDWGLAHMAVHRLRKPLYWHVRARKKATGPVQIWIDEADLLEGKA